MNLETLKNIDQEKLEKVLKFAAFLGEGQSFGSSGVNVDRCIKEYISYVELNRAPKTLEGVKLICKHLLGYFPPNRDIRTIQLRDCECFLDSLKPNAPKGIYNYLRGLRAMWNKLMRWNYVSSNPFNAVELPKRQLSKPNYVTQEMLERIVPLLHPPVIKEIVIATYYSACRLGEMVNLSIDDINLKENVMTIGNKNFQTKGRKQRIVPIHPKVREIIISKINFQKLKDGDPIIIPLSNKVRFVFAKSNGYKFTTDYVSKRFKKVCRAAGISEDIHYHSLRHGAITKMLMNGSALPAVQKIAGHSDIKITMGYTHPDLQSMVDAVGRL